MAATPEPPDDDETTNTSITPLPGRNDQTWVNVQKITFTRWINAQLRLFGSDKQVMSLTHDLSDGVILAKLVSGFSGQKIDVNPAPSGRFGKLINVEKSLSVIRKLGYELVNIDASDVVNKNEKLILALIWALIQGFQITDMSVEGSFSSSDTDGATTKARTRPKRLRKRKRKTDSASESGSESDLTSQTSTEEATPEFNPPKKRNNRRTSLKELQLKGKSTKEAFIDLVNKKLSPVGIKVKDLSESWMDGTALCFLVASYIPDFLYKDSVKAVLDSPIELIDECLDTAEEHLQVPAFLDAEDIADGVLDDMCMMTYLSNFFRKQSPSRTQLAALCEEEEEDATEDGSRKRRRSSIESGRGNSKRTITEDKSMSTDDSWPDSDNRSELSKDLLSSIHLSSVFTSSTETEEKPKQSPVKDDNETSTVKVLKSKVPSMDVIPTPEALALLDCRRQHITEASSDSQNNDKNKDNRDGALSKASVKAEDSDGNLSDREVDSVHGSYISESASTFDDKECSSSSGCCHDSCSHATTGNCGSSCSGSDDTECTRSSRSSTHSFGSSHVSAPEVKLGAQSEGQSDHPYSIDGKPQGNTSQETIAVVSQPSDVASTEVLDAGKHGDNRLKGINSPPSTTDVGTSTSSDKSESEALSYNKTTSLSLSGEMSRRSNNSSSLIHQTPNQKFSKTCASIGTDGVGSGSSRTSDSDSGDDRSQVKEDSGCGSSTSHRGKSGADNVASSSIDDGVVKRVENQDESCDKTDASVKSDNSSSIVTNESHISQSDKVDKDDDYHEYKVSSLSEVEHSASLSGINNPKKFEEQSKLTTHIDDASLDGSGSHFKTQSAHCHENSDNGSRHANSDISANKSNQDISSAASNLDTESGFRNNCSSLSNGDISTNDGNDKSININGHKNSDHDSSNHNAASDHTPSNMGSCSSNTESKQDILSKSGKFMLVRVKSKSALSSGYIKVQTNSDTETSGLLAKSSLNNSAIPENCNDEEMNSESSSGHNEIDKENSSSYTDDSINDISMPLCNNEADSSRHSSKNSNVFTQENLRDANVVNDGNLSNPCVANDVNSRNFSAKIEEMPPDQDCNAADSHERKNTSSSSFCVSDEKYAKLETDSKLLDDSLPSMEADFDAGAEYSPQNNADLSRDVHLEGVQLNSSSCNRDGSRDADSNRGTESGVEMSRSCADMSSKSEDCEKLSRCHGYSEKEEDESELVDPHENRTYDSRNDNVLMNMFGAKTDSNVSDQHSALYNVKRPSSGSLIQSLELMLSHQADVIYGRSRNSPSLRTNTDTQIMSTYSGGDSDTSAGSRANNYRRYPILSGDNNLDKTWSDFSDVCQFMIAGGSSPDVGLEKCRSLDSVLVATSPANAPLLEKSSSVDMLKLRDSLPDTGIWGISKSRSLNRSSIGTNESQTDSVEGCYISEHEQELENLGNPRLTPSFKSRSSQNDSSSTSAYEGDSSVFSSNSSRRSNPHIPKIKRKINQKDTSTDKSLGLASNQKSVASSPPPKPERSTATLSGQASAYGLSSLLADVTKTFNLPASTEFLAGNIKIRGSAELAAATSSSLSVRNQLEYDLFNPTFSDGDQPHNGLPSTLLSTDYHLNDWLKDSIKDLKSLQESTIRPAGATPSRLTLSDSRLFYDELRTPCKRVSFTPDCTNELLTPVIYDTPYDQSEYDTNLLQRINDVIQSKNLFVSNFRSSWMDGRALSALVDYKIPGFYHLHKSENSFTVLAESIEVSAKHLGIEKSITPFEVLVPNLSDDRSVFKNFLESLLNCNNHQDISNVAKVESREVALTRKLYNSTRKLSRHEELVHQFNKVLQPYPVTVSDFKKSWESGEALLCLIDTFVSGVLADGMKLNPEDRITFGLKTAMEYLNILPLVSAEELRYSQHPNQAATYLIQFLGLYDCLSAEPDPKEREKILSGKSDMTTSTHAYDAVNQSSVETSITSNTPSDPKANESTTSTGETTNRKSSTSTSTPREILDAIRSELSPDSVTSKRLPSTDSRHSANFSVGSTLDESSSEAYYSIPDRTIFLNRHLPHSCINSILHILHDRFSKTFEFDDAVCFKVEEFNICSRPVAEDGSVNLRMKITTDQACDHEKLDVQEPLKRSSKIISGSCHNSYQLIPCGRSKKVTYSPIVDSLGSDSEEPLPSSTTTTFPAPTSKPRSRWKNLAKKFVKQLSNRRKRRKMLRSIGVQVNTVPKPEVVGSPRVVGKSFLHETEGNKTKRITSYRLSSSTSNPPDDETGVHVRSLNDNTTRTTQSSTNTVYRTSVLFQTEPEVVDVQSGEVSDILRDVGVQTAGHDCTVMYKNCVFNTYKSGGFSESVTKVTPRSDDFVAQSTAERAPPPTPHQVNEVPPALPPRTKKLYSIIKEIRDAVKVDSSKRSSRSEMLLGTLDNEVASLPRDDFTRKISSSPRTDSSPVQEKVTCSETNTIQTAEEQLNIKSPCTRTPVRRTSETQTTKSTSQHIVKITLKPDECEQITSEQLSELLSKTLSTRSRERYYAGNHGNHDYSYIETPDSDISEDYAKVPQRKDRGSHRAGPRRRHHRDIFFAEKITEPTVRLRVTPQTLCRLDSNRIMEETDYYKTLEENQVDGTVQSYRRCKNKSKDSICRKCNRRKVKKQKKGRK